jgi:hypothetical protein
MHALQRSSSRGAQIVRTFALALILGAIGAGALFFVREVLAYIIGGVFSLVALLLLYSAIHQLFAMRTPQTIVETDAKTLKRGKRVQFRFQQPGDGSFESLRANLVGEEIWFTWYRGKKRRHVLQLGTFNLYDSGSFEAPFDQTVTVTIPDLPRASDPKHKTEWRLEVWGKVRGRADVQHVFPMQHE